MVAHATGWRSNQYRSSSRQKGEKESSQRREAARQRLERLAFLLDSAVRIPGTSFRVGLDGALGLIPGIGDAAGSVLALWIVYEAKRLGLPKTALARMLANVGMDFAVGAIPVLGDLFDIAFKASTRNMRIVRRYLRDQDGPIIEGRYERVR